MSTDIITDYSKTEIKQCQPALLKCMFCNFATEKSIDLKTHTQSEHEDEVSSKPAEPCISEDVKIIKDAKQMPVTKIKSLFRNEGPVSHSSNVLGNILSLQSNLLMPIDQSNIVPKEPKKSEVKDHSKYIVDLHSVILAVV